MSKSAVQIAERSTIAEISASLSTDAIIELYELNMESLPTVNNTSILRFHAGTNNLEREIIWQGNVYYPYPIEATGFELIGNKQIPRPTLSVANITTTSSGAGWGSISTLTRDYDDLVGLQINRKRTYARYLDNFCLISDNAIAGYCSNTDYNDSKVDCLRNGETWVDYTCESCSAAGGVWHVNTNSIFTAIEEKDFNLISSNNNIKHTHNIVVTPSTFCSLGNGTKNTITSTNNTFTAVDIEIQSVDGTGGILSYNIINNGVGYNSSASLELKAVSEPIIEAGLNSTAPGNVSHTHSLNLTTVQLTNLVSGAITSISSVTSTDEGHSHPIIVTWNDGLNRLNVVLSTNHDSTAHTITYNSITVPTFSNIILTDQGVLESFTIDSPGSGYRTFDAIILTPPTPIHNHNVELEYLYEGTDTTILSTNATWYASTGTTLTTEYNSGDSGHDSCIRIEANGINDYAFTDINTLKDKEYVISFDFKNVFGTSQKIEVVSDKGDGTWNTEFSEVLLGSGWQTYTKTFFTDDISRVDRTRFKIYAASSTGGASDEILIDNFIVKQNWIRGDLIHRSISNNTSDLHSFPEYNNLIISTADSEAYFEDDIYFIDRKVAENNIIIEFELAPAWDVEGIKLPKREIIQNTCLWEYKGTDGCNYSGTRYFDKSDQPTTTSSEDDCAKRLTSCELRFASTETSYSTQSSCEGAGYYWNSSLNSCWNLNTAVLPYGGFPGVGLGFRK